MPSIGYVVNLPHEFKARKPSCYFRVSGRASIVVREVVPWNTGVWAILNNWSIDNKYFRAPNNIYSWLLECHCIENASLNYDSDFMRVVGSSIVSNAFFFAIFVLWQLLNWILKKFKPKISRVLPPCFSPFLHWF